MNFLHPIEPEDSLLCIVKIYHEPAELSTNLHILSLDFSSYLHLVLPSVSFIAVSQLRHCTYFHLLTPFYMSQPSYPLHKVTPDMVKTMTLLTMQSSSSSVLSSFFGLQIFFSYS